MDTKELICFLQVYKHKSITKAANELFITPQGLSKIIKNLEIQLNVDLFYRTGTGLKATKYGEILQDKAKHIIKELDDIKNDFMYINQKKGNLSLVSSYGVLSALSLDFLVDFKKQYPDIMLKWHECTDYHVEECVLNVSVDAGLCIGPVDITRFDSMLLKSYELQLLVPENHYLAQKKTIRIEDLENENIIIESEEFKNNYSFRDECRKKGFEPNIIFQTTEISFAHKLCQQGKGLAITVEHVVKDLNSQHVIGIPFESENLTWDIYFITKKNLYKSVTLKLFEDYMKKFCLQLND